MRNAFRPANSVTKATSTTSANVKFAGGGVVRLVNLSATAANFIYVKFGINADVVATSDDIAIMAQPVEGAILVAPDGMNYIAYLAAAGTPNLNIAVGEFG